MRFLTERDVVAMIDMASAIEHLRAILIEQAAGSASNVPKALGLLPGGASIHALGAGSGDYAGFKVWLHTPGGGGSLYALFDATSGAVVTLIEARALGQLRTAAVTALATRILAPSDTKIAALVGTGVQAVTQLIGLAAAMPGLAEVRVFSPTAANRAAFVRAHAGGQPWPLVEAPTLGDAVRDAQVITLITRATEPFLNGDDLGHCRLLNAAGAILPAKAELHRDVVTMARRVIVDDVENARRNSRELRESLGDDPARWASLETLSDVVSRDPAPVPDGLTLFKPMGMGLSDLALAIALHRTAELGDAGVMLPRQTRDLLFG